MEYIPLYLHVINGSVTYLACVGKLTSPLGEKRGLVEDNCISPLGLLAGKYLCGKFIHMAVYIVKLYGHNKSRFHIHSIYFITNSIQMQHKKNKGCPWASFVF